MCSDSNQKDKTKKGMLSQFTGVSVYISKPMPHLLYQTVFYLKSNWTLAVQLAGVNDLIAYEGEYQLVCCSKFLGL